MRRAARGTWAWLAAVTTAALLSVASLAAADEPERSPAGERTGAERSTALKARADEAMDSLRYAEAADLYLQAYDAEPNPALLYNRGRALQALNDFPAALEALERFDREVTPDLRKKVPYLHELIAEVRAKVSTVTIESNVSGARVMVRDRHVGDTPLSEPLRLNAGAATIEITKEGYEPFTKKLTLEGGRTLAVEATLDPKKATGVLRVTTEVDGAVVFLDGRRIGNAPAEAEVPAGSHEILVEKPGYSTASTTAVVQVGSRRTVDVALEEERGIASKWWFWTAAGAVVVAGAVTAAVLLAPSGERTPSTGTIQPGTVAVPLTRF